MSASMKRGPLVPFFILAGGVVALGFWSMRKTASEPTAPDIVQQELAEMSRLDPELRTRFAKAAIDLGIDTTGSFVKKPTRASIDAMNELADELESKNFPLLAREARKAAAEAENRLNVY